MFDIRTNTNERYVRASSDQILLKPVPGPMRTIGGYLVLSPEQAAGLVKELHHWLEDQKGKL